MYVYVYIYLKCFWKISFLTVFNVF